MPLFALSPSFLYAPVRGGPQLSLYASGARVRPPPLKLSLYAPVRDVPKLSLYAPARGGPQLGKCHKLETLHSPAPSLLTCFGP